MDEDNSKGALAVERPANGESQFVSSSKGKREEVGGELENGDDKIKANLEVFREFNKHCKNLGLCARCQLRYLGEHYSSTSFSLAQDEVKKTINEKLEWTQHEETESASSKRFKNDTFCFCCAGLLEIERAGDEINKILSKASEFDYKFKEFKINLSLPVIVAIREQVVYAKLLNKFPQLDDHLKDCFKVKDALKFVLARRISQAANAKFSSEAKTEISIETEYAHKQSECMELYQKCKSQFTLKSKQKFDLTFSNSTVTRALSQLGVKGLISLKLDRPDKQVGIQSVTITNQAVFLVGRYNKYSRELSQTPWLVKENINLESLEDIITRVVVKYIPCQKTKFMASGREDIDVRMLGRGRPFLLEFINPVSLDVDESQFGQIKNEIKSSSNGRVNVNDLQLGDKEDIIRHLKQGESKKQKIYRALCVATRPIGQEDIDKLHKIEDLKIDQETPMRVLHRRTMSTRPKTIHKLQFEPIENECQKFGINLTTEAGTYVKEFVNSDFGRTTPSLATILGECETDILELDVLEICFDWPPKIEETV